MDDQTLVWAFIALFAVLLAWIVSPSIAATLADPLAGQPY